MLLENEYNKHDLPIECSYEKFLKCELFKMIIELASSPDPEKQRESLINIFKIATQKQADFYSRSWG